MKRRTKSANMKITAKAARINNPGEKSKYSKKFHHLRRHGGWGFEYKEKPWK